MALSKIDTLLKKLAEAHPGKTGWDRFLAYKGHTWDDVIETDLGDPTDEEKKAITDLGYYGAPISQKTVNGLATASHYKPESPFSMHIEFPGERGSGPKFFKSKAELIKAANEMGGGEAHDKATSWINDSGARISIEGATYGEVFPKHTAVPSATDPDADYHNEPPERPSHQGPPHPHDRWSDREFESNTGLSKLDGLLKKLPEVMSGAPSESSTKGSYPFADKQKQYRGYSDAGLDYSVKDASDAMKAMKGHDPSAENWYRDDVATIRQEIERRRGKKTKTEDGTAGPHDALAADPDYKSVTPREQNFLQNFLGSATGHNSNDRMNFHNDVKSYGYKNPDKLTKLFSKHYPAFSASAQKGEARSAHGSSEKLDALLNKLTEDGDAGFDAWMKKVDAEVKKMSGMAVADLDDAPYRDWYEDDLSPSRAARRAIQNAGGEQMTGEAAAPVPPTDVAEVEHALADLTTRVEALVKKYPSLDVSVLLADLNKYPASEFLTKDINQSPYDFFRSVWERRLRSMLHSAAHVDSKEQTNYILNMAAYAAAAAEFEEWIKHSAIRIRLQKHKAAKTAEPARAGI